MMRAAAAGIRSLTFASRRSLKTLPALTKPLV